MRLNFGLVRELSAFETPINFGKCCPDKNDFILDQMFIRLADNEDSHTLLNVFLQTRRLLKSITLTENLDDLIGWDDPNYYFCRFVPFS